MMCTQNSKIYTRPKYVYVLLTILYTSLSGCTFANPFVKHDYVDVPYPVSCITWEPARAQSTFTTVDANAPLWEQVKALLIDRENDNLYIEGQASVIAGCK